MRPLLVMGNAPCLDDDLASIDVHGFDLMAINRAALRVLHPIAFLATYHPVTMAVENWIGARGALGGNTDFVIVSPARCVDRGNNVQFNPGCMSGGSGSSTLLGVLFGLSQGYSSIVVAGAPLDTPEYAMYHNSWNYASDALRGKVESKSGWTQTFLEGLSHAH